MKREYPTWIRLTRVIGVVAGVCTLVLTPMSIIDPDPSPPLLTMRLFLLGVLLILPWHNIRNRVAWAVLYALLVFVVGWYTIPQCLMAVSLARMPISGEAMTEEMQRTIARESEIAQLPQVLQTVFFVGTVLIIIFSVVAWAQLLAVAVMRRRNSNQAPEAASETAPGADSSSHQG